jgi:hypothetical protein
MLTAPIDAARAETAWHSGAIANLCGTAAITPSTLDMRAATSRKAARSAGRTCAGTSTASAPRARRVRVAKAGAFTWAMGSPTMKMTQVAPL